MKQFYLILFLLLTAYFSHSQVKTWVGPDNGLWSEPLNWSPDGVPNGLLDVIIPPGSIVLLDGGADADTVTVQSGAILNQSGISEFVATLVTIEEGAVYNYSEGNFSGSLDIYGNMNVSGVESKEIWYGEQNIYGSLVIEDGAELGLRNNTLIIQSEGACTMEGAGEVYIAAFTADLRNEGLIEKAGSGEFDINVPFVNQEGIISVINGHLNIANTCTFVNGNYNVSEESSITTQELLFLEGMCVGLLNGPLIVEAGFRPPAGEVATLDFTGTSEVIWSGGQLSSGDLINESSIAITGEAAADIAINGVDFVNNGEVNITTTENMTISNGGIFHNTAEGTTNFLSDQIFTSSFSGSFLNEGLMKKSASDGITQLIFLENMTGTIQVDSGTLQLASGANFTDGTYTVSSGASIVNNLNTILTLDGDLTGTLDGSWDVYSGFRIETDNQATLDFAGESAVNWYAGNISGGGQLSNLTALDVSTLDGFPTQILQNTTLENQGLITMLEESSISMSSNGVLHNILEGIIDIKSDESIVQFSSSSLINDGLIKKTNGEGTFNISVSTEHNSTGIISPEIGTIQLTSITGDGNFSGAGSLTLPNIYLLQGTVSPGNSPGILTYTNDYNSTSESVLQIELNGALAGDEYDLLDVMGEANVSGTINVDLGFAPQLNDEFVILQSNGDLICTDFVTSTTATFEGEIYTFEVLCNDDNITLRLLTVGVKELESGLDYSLFPNPFSSVATLKLNQPIHGNNSRVILTNSLGMNVKEVKIASGESLIQIDRTGLESGLYYLTLLTENGITLTHKLVVK